MFSLIEARNYRCLRYVRQPLRPFQVLVGPNASGKTTFLDVISFLGDLVSHGPDFAVTERSENYKDLVWGRTDERIELAVEASIAIRRFNKLFLRNAYDTVRYEVSLGLDKRNNRHSIFAENVFFKKSSTAKARSRGVFPTFRLRTANVVTMDNSIDCRKIVKKTAAGMDTFYAENVFPESGNAGLRTAFKLGPEKSALGNLPDDDERFPAATWLRRLLTTGTRKLELNTAVMKRPSRPGKGIGFKHDGSNLPWIVSAMRRDDLAKWVAHIQTALPDIVGIRTVLREDDRHRYLVLDYKGGLSVPSWMVSDGTLRLLALTLPAYLTDFEGVYLIEEPENGIHPRAIETAYQSLSSVYESQVLLATHSPLIVSIVKPEDVLCFAKKEGATDIVSGDQHPMLRDWRGESDLGTLYAGGVLG